MLDRTAGLLTGLSRRVPRFTGQPEYFAGFVIIMVVVVIAWHVTVGATDYALQTFVPRRYRRNIPLLGKFLLHAAIMLVILSGIAYVVWRVVSAVLGPSITSAG